MSISARLTVAEYGRMLIADGPSARQLAAQCPLPTRNPAIGRAVIFVAKVGMISCWPTRTYPRILA